MQNLTQGILTVAGQVMIATIFLTSAVGSKVPKFGDVAGYMASEGVPLPKVMPVGAILFLITGVMSLAARLAENSSKSEQTS